VVSGAFGRRAPVPTACFKFAAKKSCDSVRFLFEFPFSEMDDAVPGSFEGSIGGAFVRVAVGATGAVDLDCDALLLPEEIDHHSRGAFS
jgi:hypothetical protein